jgi:serine/threonine-protein kinase
MTRHETSEAGLSVDAAVELDRVCDAFESAWRSRCRPAIEPAVAALSGDVRAAAVPELIELDVYYRRAGRRTPCSSRLLRQVHRTRTILARPSDPARCRAGERPAPADYSGRFTELEQSWLDRVTRPDAPVSATGWTRPLVLRDDPSDHSPIVRPFSADMPKADPARLQLFGEIARGGMGVILKGRDPTLGRDLAIKVLKAEYTGRAMAEERFVEEAQVGGQLQHPGVVPVYELSRFADGRPFFTMKLVKGRTLAALLTERKTPANDRGRFLQHFQKVCDTIAYAHSRGVIHRDLKPANVMVGNFGEVQVMDWGLAKVLPRGGVADERLASRGFTPSDDSQNEPTVIETVRVGSIGSDTQAGSVLGTPAYMPPEQAGGEIDKLDERADVFGLGAILFVILTGHPPYLADTAEATRLMAIRGQLGEAFARLDAAGGDRDLVEMCKRCLSAKREERPRHAGDVADAMKAYLETVEDRAHRAEVERAKAEATAAGDRKRHRIQRALAASLLGLVVLVGGTAWWVQSQRAARAAELAKARSETEVIVKDAIADANRALDDGRWLDVAAAIKRGEDRLGAGDSFPEMRAALQQVRTDREMAVALERAHGAAFDGLEDQKQSSFKNVDVEATRSAFEAYGFPAWDMEADAIKERLRVSRIGRLLTEELVDLSRRERKPGEYIFPRLNETMDQVDDDPYRRKLSDARKRKDTATVLAMAEDPALRDQSAVTVTRVVQYLREKDQPVSPAALSNLRLILLAHPNDAALHNAMALMLVGKGRPEDRKEAIGYSQIVVALRPQSAFAARQLGVLFLGAGLTDASVAKYRDAIRLDPFHVGAHISLGFILLSKRDLPGAEAEYREAIRLAPHFAFAHSYLGMVLREKRDLPGAEAEYREAIRLEPRFTHTHLLLGIVLQDQGDLPGAEAEYREAIRLNRNFLAAHLNLGIVLQIKGDLAAVETEYCETVRLFPKSGSPHGNLAWFLATGPERVRDGKRAVELATRACELTEWKNAVFLDTLAAAYAEVGEFEKAIEVLKKALGLPNAEKQFGPEFRERLALYEKKKPYRDPKLSPR